MKTLRISDSLSLPPDAVTSTIVVYGGKGMGKTNLASVLVEEFAAAHLRFAVIDPMGVWWGLRHAADGKSPGIKAAILGGVHGDVPIDPTSGALVADLVVDENENVIVDISRRSDGSMWAVAERIRFVTDYAKRLYQRQGEKRRPIMQVIDEAARFAPQIVRAGDLEVAKCMGAVAVIVEEGRNVGIGVALVTQRSARLNKDVAELADCMIAFRTVGPNSMRAVLDWLGEHVEKARFRDIGEELRSLPRGSALVVSPGWLEFEGVVAMRKRETFDSSATPKSGQALRVSGPGAKVDVAKYRARMAEVIERANANDPQALKAEVARLKKVNAELAAGAVVKQLEAPTPAPALKDAQIKRLETLLAISEKLAVKLAAIADRASADVAAIREAIAGPKPAARIVRRDEPRASVPVPRTNGHHRERGNALPLGEAAVLAALIQYPTGLFRRQLTVLTGYKRSTRDAYIARLRERGLVDIDGDCVIVTSAGYAALPNAAPLPTGAALQDHWLQRLPIGEAAILMSLLEANGTEKTRDELTERTGFKRSTRDAYIQRLAAKELVVEVGRGFVKASPTLFEVA